MAFKKLFVGNIPWKSTEDELKAHFEPIGKVGFVRILIDHESGKSRGIGFIGMENGDEAMAQLDGKEFQSRNLFVREAIDKRPEQKPKAS